jgi:hypothetical protein
LAKSATRPPVPGLGSSASKSMRTDVAGRDLRGGGLFECLHAQQRVGVVQHSLIVDPEPVSTDEIGIRDDHPPRRSGW